MLKLHNTLSKKTEEFLPLNPPIVTFYQCGPTVYWTQHLGNMMAMTMGDLIRRSLIYLGFKVKYVRNYTDFGHLTSDADEGEDKMEKGAKREGKTPQEIADKYIAEFEKDIRQLNLLDPDVKARATEYVEGMIQMVEILLKKGYAYVTPSAIYFDTSKMFNYTELSGVDMQKNIQGLGHGDVLDTENKKNPADFVVWFFKTGPHKNAIQYWQSPFKSSEVENGAGFPGWAIECSTMALVNLGKTIDIHMGGIEHIPIHHTNEIAQSEAANGVKYVNYWLHNGHLFVDGGKMAKSSGSSYVLSDVIAKGYDPMHLRYFFLQAHYRSMQNFTWKGLDAAKNAYEKLIRFMKTTADIKIEENISKSKKILAFKQRFVKALEDDINIPEALSILWDVVKTDFYSLEEKKYLLLDFDKVFGILPEDINHGKKEEKIPEEILKLVGDRTEARSKKEFASADKIRQQIEQKGYIVEDTSTGSIISKK